MLAVRGINGGVKVLSNVNMLVALGLLIFSWRSLVVWPVLKPFNAMAHGNELIPFKELHVVMMKRWQVDLHTYWACGMSWSPFVGMFIVASLKVVRFVSSSSCCTVHPNDSNHHLDDILVVSRLIKWRTRLVRSVSMVCKILRLFHTYDALPMSSVLSVVSIV